LYGTIAENGSLRLTALLSQRLRLDLLMREANERCYHPKNWTELIQNTDRWARLVLISDGLDQQIRVARTMTMTCSIAFGLGGDSDGHGVQLEGPA
jgi:hypothetical protein